MPIAASICLAATMIASAPPAATPATPPAAAASAAKLNTLTPEEAKAGWILLFDGKDAGAHLRGYRKTEMPKEWAVEDGTIVLRGKGGDLVTKDEFADFEFVIDWKIAEGGNSGVMWRVTEDHTYPWETGLEMQVLDDTKHPDGKSRLTSAGACYALYPAPEGAVKPVGQWNTARILAVGPKITYELNGVKTAEFDMSSVEYKALVAGSKFAAMPDFGQRAKGHIALQDHGDVVAYRNIKIRPIGTAAGAPTTKPADGAAKKSGAGESKTMTTPKSGAPAGTAPAGDAPAKKSAP